MIWIEAVSVLEVPSLHFRNKLPVEQRADSLLGVNSERSSLTWLRRIYHSQPGVPFTLPTYDMWYCILLKQLYWRPPPLLRNDRAMIIWICNIRPKENIQFDVIMPPFDEERAYYFANFGWSVGWSVRPSVGRPNGFHSFSFSMGRQFTSAT